MKVQVGGRLLKIRKRGCRAPLRLSKFVRRLLCFLRPRISRSRSPALICAEGKRIRPSSFPADCEISMEESVVGVKGMGRRRKLVPEGFVAVCVGEDLQRFVIPIVYLSHPFFRKLLGQAEEEFGYPRDGPLAMATAPVTLDPGRGRLADVSLRGQADVYHKSTYSFLAVNYPGW